jgi:hypothetical protein
MLHSPLIIKRGGRSTWGDFVNETRVVMKDYSEYSKESERKDGQRQSSFEFISAL